MHTNMTVQNVEIDDNDNFDGICGRLRGQAAYTNEWDTEKYKFLGTHFFYIYERAKNL